MSGFGAFMPKPIAFGDPDLSDITVVVGKQEFLLHKRKLAKYSDVFERMLYGHFKEANQDRIVIKDVSATVFKRLMEVVYYGKVQRCDKLFRIGCLFLEDSLYLDDVKEIFCSDSVMCQLLKAADQFNISAKMVLDGIKDDFNQMYSLEKKKRCEKKHCVRCICLYLILLDRDGTITVNKKLDRSSMAAVAREIAKLTDKLIPMDDAKLENIANLLKQVGDFEEDAPLRRTSHVDDDY